MRSPKVSLHRQATVVSATVLCLLASAWKASAQDQPKGIKRSGFELALRSGYAVPLGDAQEGVELDDDIAGQVPIELDLGYRDGEHMTFGLYFHYGFGSQGMSTEGLCNLPGLSCSARVLRAGVQLLYHFAPKKPVGAWISLGAGAEQLRLGIDNDAADAHGSIVYTGFEVGSFHLGLDFRGSSGLSIGPFMGVLNGKYLDVSSECRGCTTVPGASIGETSFHHWFVVGIRGALLL